MLAFLRRLTTTAEPVFEGPLASAPNRPNTALPADPPADAQYRPHGCSVTVCVRPMTSAAVADDIAACLPAPDGLLLLLADGAGPRGCRAPRVLFRAVQRALEAMERPPSGNDLAAILVDADAALRGSDAGTTTAILGYLGGGRLTFVRVGDSETWSRDEYGPVEISGGERNQRVGAGITVPAPTVIGAITNPIVIGSDGLWRYLWPENALALLKLSQGRSPAAALASAVQSRWGQFTDDLSVIVILPTSWREPPKGDDFQRLSAARIDRG